MTIAAFLIVFGLGAVELWVAVPAGLALRLHPIAIAITTAAGGLVGVLIIGCTGNRVQSWLLRRRGGTPYVQPSAALAHVWARYGVAGLGLLAPLLIGAPLGTALGMTLGAPTTRLLFWMSVGVLLCSIGLTLAGTLGLIGVQSLAS